QAPDGDVGVSDALGALAVSGAGVQVADVSVDADVSDVTALSGDDATDAADSVTAEVANADVAADGLSDLDVEAVDEAVAGLDADVADQAPADEAADASSPAAWDADVSVDVQGIDSSAEMSGTDTAGAVD